jgi:hypothetical protein
MKLIAGALITAVLLSACSPASTPAPAPDNSEKIKAAIKTACDNLTSNNTQGIPLGNEKTALAFNEIVKLDEKYTPLAVDAFMLVTFGIGYRLGVDNKELQAEQFKATARLIQFCALHS